MVVFVPTFGGPQLQDVLQDALCVVSAQEGRAWLGPAEIEKRARLAVAQIVHLLVGERSLRNVPPNSLQTIGIINQFKLLPPFILPDDAAQLVVVVVTR